MLIILSLEGGKDMRVRMCRRALVLVVIVLFVGASVIPSINVAM